MSLPEIPSASLVSKVTNLLHEAGVVHASFALTPLSGGANNRVYRVELQEGASFVLKHYFFSPDDRRDRFFSEKSFYDFLKAARLQERAPAALAWDPLNRLGLFSWIEGRRLRAEEVNRAMVDQALSFYFALNAHQHLPEASTIPNGSEACFSLQQHFACVERRLSRLATIAIDSTTGREAHDFICHRLKPAFENYQQLHAESLPAEAVVLAADQRCLSPSDFGFHNALLPGNGTLAFFDFEYAGWDDPAKFLCDFLCQPSVPVPRDLWLHCVQSLCRPVPGGTHSERIALLLPLYHLKWCCIMLNEFLPAEHHRRTFSRKLSPLEMEAARHDQLVKARHLLETFATVDLTQSLGFDDTARVIT